MHCKAFWLGLLLLVTGPSWSAEAMPPVDLLITYETKAVDHDGVTRSARWQDRLIRRAGHIWTERVLPAARIGTAESAQDHAGHAHFDISNAAQHLSREADGKLRAEYVDAEHRQVVFVPREEYGTIGFDGSWDIAAYLVPPATLSLMPVRTGAAPAGTTWREERRKGWFTRVLWDNEARYARVIESGRIDGTVWRRTTATSRPLMPDTRLPWRELQGYERKDYADFMD